MRKTIVILLALVLVLTSSGMAVCAAQPDRTFTYEEENPVPSTNVYQVMTIIDEALMGTTQLKDARDIFVDNSDRVFILDSGNTRVLVLDKNYHCQIELKEFKHGEETITLGTGAEGLFYREANKLLYIADTTNNRILVSDLEGKISKIYTYPVDELLDPNESFQPKKIIVDNMGIMYVTSGSYNEGALLIDSSGSFLGFYGTTKVSETAAMKLERTWRKLMKKAQIRETAQPVEFNNIFWSNDRFVYAVSNLHENIITSILKLNALGTNVFPKDIDLKTLQKNRNLNIIPKDITVDNEGAITILDSGSCRLYQYDEGCNLLAIFGGKGYQQGLFHTPLAVECDSENRLLVLDNFKNTITVLEQTFYGIQIRSANYLYNQGLYSESKEPWEAVLTMNANYTQAYVGLGKAYFGEQNYKEAMKNFQLGKDPEGYAEAKAALRDEIVRQNFALVAAVVVLGMFAILGWDAITNIAWKLRRRFMK